MSPQHRALAYDLLDSMLEVVQSIDEASSRGSVHWRSRSIRKNDAFTGHSVFTTDPSDAPGDALMTGEPLRKALTDGPPVCTRSRRHASLPVFSMD
jgi:hypothetical protein